MATDGKATKRATASEGDGLTDGTVGEKVGVSDEGLTAGNEATGSDAVTGGTRGTTVGLADGTPGCEGVCLEGEYDPRFDRKSDQFRKFGFIYKITCLVNGKVYIGQTTRSVRKRWRCHVDEPRYKPADRLNPIDSAILKYGEDSFRVETIEKVLDEYLGIREQYWIQHYDCCTLDGHDKGYNASRGGDPNRRYILDEQDVIRTYEMGCSVPWIMFVLQVRAPDAIRDVLIKHGIPQRTRFIYKSSDLPECIIDAYYRNTGKKRPAKRSRRGKGTHAARNSASSQSSNQASPITLAQFDRSTNLIHYVHDYEELIDWAFQSGLTHNPKREAVKRYVSKKIVDSHYVVFRMFQHYWIVLDEGDDVSDAQVMSRCQGLVAAFLNGQYAGNTLLFEENIDAIILDIVNSSIREVAKSLGIKDNTLKKRLQRHGLPYKVLDLFRYAVDNHLIDDPVGDAKDYIYEVFCSTNDLDETVSICMCSKSDVYFACRYHGIAAYALDRMRDKKEAAPRHDIKVYQSDGTYVCTLTSINEASRYTGVPSSTVSRSRHHRNIQAPYYFRFADEEEDNMNGDEDDNVPPSGG